jgi:hypothetical protein
LSAGFFVACSFAEQARSTVDGGYTLLVNTFTLWSELAREEARTDGKDFQLPDTTKPAQGGLWFDSMQT